MTRTFLITGASKGIGLALAQSLCVNGHRVIGIARSTSSDFPGELVQLDLSDADETKRVLGDLGRSYQIDGVVNNVGLARLQRLDEIELSGLDEVLRLNLHPAVLAAQAALPGMRARRWGRIINISSLSIVGLAKRSAYSAAKAALVSFTRCWALELATMGITVNAVAPGPTETELFRKNIPRGSPAEVGLFARVPMRRFGQPKEIAAAVAFLLSEEAGFITGQTLHVDGGASIGSAAI